MVRAAVAAGGAGPPTRGHRRVDVTISSSFLSRALRPTILMEMTLSDGRVKCFEMPVEVFHELRYNVAKVLKGMRTLERHPVMRIAFDMEKARMDAQDAPE